MRLTTVRGYQLSDVASALQKTIRRGEVRLAGYFAAEMFASGYQAYAWRRLLTISAEDCAGCITQEVKALHESWRLIHEKGPKKKGGGRVFLAKAVILLCEARKSRDADHLNNLVYDRNAVDESALLAALDEARRQPEPIPDYAFDCHTGTGKRRGKTRTDFFLDEYDALAPRVPGFFDDDVEQLRRTRELAPKLTRTFPSKSTRGVHYTAHFDPATGRGTCDCPGYRYPKAGEARSCAHVRALQTECEARVRLDLKGQPK